MRQETFTTFSFLLIAVAIVGGVMYNFGYQTASEEVTASIISAPVMHVARPVSTTTVEAMPVEKKASLSFPNTPPVKKVR